MTQFHGDDNRLSSDVIINCKQNAAIPDKMNRVQYASAFIVTLSLFSCGAFLSWTTSALHLLSWKEDVLQTTESERSWLSSLVCLGAFVGSALIGYSSEVFMRSLTIFTLTATMVVAWILTLFSTSIYCYYVGRLVGGFAIGGLCIALPSYTADLLQRRHIASGLGWPQASAGVLLGFAAGLTQSMVILALVCGSTAVIFFVTFLFLPESAVYLMSQSKDEEAENSLEFMKGACTQTDVNRIRQLVQDRIQYEGQYKDLITSKANFKASIVGVYLMIFLQLGGVIPILFNLNDVFKVFETKIPSGYCTLIIGATIVASTCLFSWKIRLFRRRRTLMVANSIMTISACFISLYSHLAVAMDLTSLYFIPIVLMAIYVGTFSMGVAPVSFLILDEIFLDYLKKKSAVIGVSITWLVAFMVTKYYQNMVDQVGIGWAVWNFGFSCGLSGLIAYFLVPETKGKSSEEIHGELNGDYDSFLRFKYVIEVDSGSSTDNNSTAS